MDTANARMKTQANHFSFGNTKLPKSTAIFNMTPASYCPADRLNKCALLKSNRCYAKKSERLYPQVLPFRSNQALFWNRCTPKEFVEKLLKERGRKNIKLLRFNEAGDFGSQKDVQKAATIARLLKAHGIGTYCYTARNDLNFTRRKDLVVTGSNFMVDNQFTVVYNKKDLKGIVCPSNCRICNICSKRDRKTIKTHLH